MRTFEEVKSHAQESFPEECCGFVLERDGREEVMRIANRQGLMHEKDPDSYPRTASVAYFMDPRELAQVECLVAAGKASIKFIYHSHPNHEAYFSSEDRERAKVWDEPIHPEAAYLVLSVCNGTFQEAKAFRWNEVSRDFAEIPLNLSPEADP